MAINNKLNQVLLDDGVNKTQAQKNATAYGTATTNGNPAYEIGQSVGDYWKNNALANANNRMAQPFETAAGAVGLRNFFSGLFGGKPTENPYLQPAIDLNRQANNYRIKNVGGNAVTPTTPDATGDTTDTTTSSSTNSTTDASNTASKINAYSGYYDTERSYQQEALKREREAAIQRAKLAYQQAINPYGVQAEALASSGLAANGGYGQRMQQARYNAYANAVNTASNQYQQDVAALDRQLAYQKYSEEMTDKQNAYSNIQNEYNTTNNLISGAVTIGSKVATVRGNKIKNEAEVMQYIKNVYPAIDDGTMQTVLAMIRSGK